MAPKYVANDDIVASAHITAESEDAMCREQEYGDGRVHLRSVAQWAEQGG